MCRLVSITTILLYSIESKSHVREALIMQFLKIELLM